MFRCILLLSIYTHNLSQDYLFACTMRQLAIILSERFCRFVWFAAILDIAFFVFFLFDWKSLWNGLSIKSDAVVKKLCPSFCADKKRIDVYSQCSMLPPFCCLFSVSFFVSVELLWWLSSLEEAFSLRIAFTIISKDLSLLRTSLKRYLNHLPTKLSFSSVDEKLN